MFDFITIGGVTRDIFLKYDDLGKSKSKNSICGSFLLVPYGEKLVADDAFYTYGGGAANAAICLARLGAKAAPFCNIGAEGTGSLVTTALASEGINTTLITRDPKHHTGLSIFILGKDNEHTGFLERGANNYLKVENLNFLKKTKWIYLSSLTGESASFLPEIFQYAEKQKIKIAFNPGSQQILEGQEKIASLMKKSEILILNMEEAEALVRSGGKRKPKNRRELFRRVENFGAGMTVVTDAEEGSHVITGGKVYSQKAFPKKVIDTTGAGDSFGATFAFGIANDFKIEDALKIAAINSASVVATMGAQDGLLSLNEIRQSRWF